MKIYGLQKMTLLDFPGHVACTVFLGGCDFRCPFCHNFDLATGKSPPQMDELELLSFLCSRRELLEGVAITGGEPCLSSGLHNMILRIKDLGLAVKLDTNGNHPERLRALMEDGLLDYVAMDIKNRPVKYARTCGVEVVNMKKICESVSVLMNGTVPYEFRTTVVDEFHTLRDFEEIAEWVHGASRYFLQPFVDRDTVPFAGLHAPSAELMRQYADALTPHVGRVELRGVD